MYESKKINTTVANRRTISWHFKINFFRETNLERKKKEKEKRDNIITVKEEITDKVEERN